MPRKPLGDRPMTAAERQRRHRARLRKGRPKTPAQIIDALRKENARLRRLNASSMKEIERLRRSMGVRSKERQQ